MNAYSFTAAADPQCYATITGFGGSAADTLIDVIAPASTMTLEAGDDDGAIGRASNIAGTMWTMAGTCRVTMRESKTAILPGLTRPYEFFVRVLSGSPIPETEPSEGAPRAPRSNGWVNRMIGPATAGDDSFAITVNGGDTIMVVVGIDRERGAPEWRAITGVGEDSGSFIMINGGRIVAKWPTEELLID